MRSNQLKIKKKGDQQMKDLYLGVVKWIKLREVDYELKQNRFVKNYNLVNFNYNYNHDFDPFMNE